MADIITPFGNGDTQPEQPYDLMHDQAAFATEITQVIRNHPNLPPAVIIGGLTMIASDVHHIIIADQQKMAMAQEAMARVNANRIKQSPN